MRARSSSKELPHTVLVLSRKRTAAMIKDVVPQYMKAAMIKDVVLQYMKAAMMKDCGTKIDESSHGEILWYYST
ncbi:hypothetical protein NDU88_007832 [Pleurodeles waltl]|uniref:Uncharacterized protein n=1 Tax=Pleurodeles waltl TaxID=8319 RepID=A0AAV7U4E6_PLEWA|nr:hypothetical protein NDU88_007832 [Pleurodeles waltl]